MGQLILAGAVKLFPALTGFAATNAAIIGANFLASTLLTSVAMRLSRPKASEVREELRFPQELPSYRHARGPGTRVPGTPWYMGEKGNDRYFAYLLNSRVSDTSGFTLRLDGRDVTLSGDPFNSGPLTRGTVTLAEGETQIVITHGFGATPQSVGVYADGIAATIDMKGDTTFRATLPDPAPAGGLVLRWVCCSAAAGAVGVNSPFVDRLEVWVQDGSQTHPPTKILVENGDLFCGNSGSGWAGQTTENPVWHTDKYTGNTMVWIKMDLGAPESRRERWPNPIPQLDATMGWSRIWDMRDETQDPHDPDTWQASANQALHLLDAALTNPVSPWPRASIWLEIFRWAADVADLPRGQLDGGSHPQWQVGGVQTFGGRELPAILAELAEAGGGDLFTAGGRLAYRPACWVEPDVTLTRYYKEGEVSFERDRDRTQTPQAVRAIYADPGADWEDATFPPVPVSDAWGGDESRVLTLSLPLVSNPYQAMHLQQIEARKLGLGKKFTAVFPPNPAADLVATAPVTLGLPSLIHRNGAYRVESKDGLFFMADPDAGVAMRVSMTLQEDAEHVWPWVPETDELPYELADTDVLDLSLPAPTGLTAEFVSGGLRITWNTGAEVFSGATGYSWEWRENGGPWQLGGTPGASLGAGTGVITVTLQGVNPSAAYDVRVQSLADGRASAYAQAGPFVAPGASTAIDDLTEPGLLGQTRSVTGLPGGTQLVIGDGEWWRRVSNSTIVSAARYLALFDAGEYQAERVPGALSTVLGLTRASTGTYIDADGVLQTAAVDAPRIDHLLGTPALLIEPATQNLCLRSEQFDNATWTTAGITRTADAVVAPDGTMTAETLLSTTASPVFSQAISKAASALQYTFGMFIRPAAGVTSFGMTLDGANTANRGIATLDLSAMTLTSLAAMGTFSGAAFEMHEIADDWHLLFLTVTSDTATTIRPRCFWTTSGHTVSPWGAQVNLGGPRSYVPTTSAAVTRAADVPLIKGVTAMLDLAVTYGDGTTASLPGQLVSPSYWPALSQSRIRRIVGRNP